MEKETLQFALVNVVDEEPDEVPATIGKVVSTMRDSTYLSLASILHSLQSYWACRIPRMTVWRSDSNL